ncbi:hypothetical protein FHS86_002535 [Roseimarinus sediminis]
MRIDGIMNIGQNYMAMTCFQYHTFRYTEPLKG